MGQIAGTLIAPDGKKLRMEYDKFYYQKTVVGKIFEFIAKKLYESDYTIIKAFVKPDGKIIFQKPNSFPSWDRSIINFLTQNPELGEIDPNLIKGKEIIIKRNNERVIEDILDD